MLLLFIFITFAAAQTAECNTGITCTYDPASSSLTISSESDTKKLSSIILKDGLSNPHISEVIFGPGVEEVSGYIDLFSYNDALTTISCNNCDLKKIGDSLFPECTALQRVNIPTLEEIEKDAFYKNTALKEFNFDSVKTIGNNCFQESVISTVKFTDKLQSLGQRAFYEAKVEKFEVSGTSSYFASHDNVLYQKTEQGLILLNYPRADKKTSFKVHDDCIEIKSEAIHKVTALTSIDLNKVQKVEQLSLSELSSLTSISLGSKLVEIELRAFHNCNAVSEYIVPQDNEFFMTGEDGILYTKDVNNKALVKIPPAMELDEEYSIPAGVKVIYNNAFEGRKTLKKIEIGGDVYSIHSSAFAGCENLETVIITANIRSIGSHVFADLPKLSSVSLGDGVKMIGKGMFSSCTELKEITLGEGILSIEKSAFFRSGLTSVIIPDAVKFIMDGAFMECGNLESVKIGHDVLEINSNAFGSNPKLQSVDFSNAETLIRIDSSAFSGSDVLDEITIPANVLIISAGAFASSPMLNSVTFDGLKQPAHCSSEAFDNSILDVVYVPDEYIHEEFCGIPVDQEPEQPPEPSSTSSMMIAFFLTLFMILF